MHNEDIEPQEYFQDAEKLERTLDLCKEHLQRLINSVNASEIEDSLKELCHNLDVEYKINQFIGV